MGNFVGGELKINEEANMTPNNEDTKKKIIDTSQKIQEVLLLLLSDNDDLRQRLEQEASDRKKETAELRERLVTSKINLTKKLQRDRVTGIDFKEPSMTTPV